MFKLLFSDIQNTQIGVVKAFLARLICGKIITTDLLMLSSLQRDSMCGYDNEINYNCECNRETKNSLILYQI
jgi:hypothetical protein